jgi:hypothetical protein
LWLSYHDRHWDPLWDPRRRKNCIDGNGTHAGVPEFKQRWSVRVLVITSKVQAKLMTGPTNVGANRERQQVPVVQGGRSVPIDGALEKVIERRRAARQVKTASGLLLASFVFHHEGKPAANFRKAWATACVVAGLGRFTCRPCEKPESGHRCQECNTDALKYSGRLFHDLRRSAVRDMVRAGRAKPSP